MGICILVCMCRYELYMCIILANIFYISIICIVTVYITSEVISDILSTMIQSGLCR